MSVNTDAVEVICESFGTGDVPAILARLAPDVAWEHDWGGASLKSFAQRKGRDAAPAFFASLAEFESIRFEPFAFLDGDSRVAVAVRLKLVHRANGKRIRDLAMHLWTFAPNGRIAGFGHVVDTLQWAQATQAQVAAEPVTDEPSTATVRFRGVSGRPQAGPPTVNRARQALAEYCRPRWPDAG
jgi:ketosteroid isomerase-like protein